MGKALTHGHTISRAPSRTYVTWSHMIQRCTNPKRPAYARYGGRGITVCDRWLKFENFLADMGERPDGKTLDRFPNNKGNYEPGNCRWATVTEQNQNRAYCKPKREPGRPRGTPIDMTGQRFGMLVVTAFSHSSPHRHSAWHCLCDCGKPVVRNRSTLVVGESTSCGCLSHKKKAEMIRLRNAHKDTHV